MPVERQCVGLGHVAARLDDVKPVGDAQVPLERGMNFVGLEPGLHDPKPIERTFPMERQPPDSVRDRSGAFDAFHFTSNYVAMHVTFFRACGSTLAPDAATNKELL